ncbi:MAG: hypothetical protein U9O59_02140 [Actinomycetota bacterium]|nr:hypothetical protein [Actinomycetota bacterium]
MTIGNINSSDSGGIKYKDEPNYTTAQSASSGNDLDLHGYFYVGQRKSVTDYNIYRGFIYFDTSILNDAALIQSGYIRLVCVSNYSDTDYNIILKSGQPTYPHDTLELADYDIDHYSGNGGSINTSEIHETTWEYITLNATSLNWINKEGLTKLALISSRDFSKIAPSGWETVRFYPYNATNSDNRPLLHLVYTIPTGIPVVGDPTYSNTKATYIKATANVSDDGGGYEERGFEYGLSEVASWATRETGVFTGTGNFSMAISGLLPLTTYYARAYVLNNYGTGYSDWTSFTTTDVPAYGLYEEDNTATISFYLSEDDGMTWGQKHGPYTEDQADIEITKLLVRGAGKKKIKFTSDVLTGISASVMVKQDIKAR